MCSADSEEEECNCDERVDDVEWVRDKVWSAELVSVSSAEAQRSAHSLRSRP